uniref:Uncharacterized protein n=1 Tax=Knipowitschia caucasica TaxID=637954 RepID=A0AAV2LQW4_KNICA
MADKNPAPYWAHSTRPRLFWKKQKWEPLQDFGARSRWDSYWAEQGEAVLWSHLAVEQSEYELNPELDPPWSHPELKPELGPPLRTHLRLLPRASDTGASMGWTS